MVVPFPEEKAVSAQALEGQAKARAAYLEGVRSAIERGEWTFSARRLAEALLRKLGWWH